MVRSRFVRAVVPALVVALCLPVGAGAQATRRVGALDDLFEPEVVRVDPGDTVVWRNEGRNPHTVTADDGSFDSGTFGRGKTFGRAFPQAGRYPYFCSLHGAAGGLGMSGLVLVGAQAGGGATKTFPPPPTAPGRTIRVPRDRATIQGAADAARPGDLILVSPGIYREAVRVVTPYIAIRGLDRNTVILDGEFTRHNGIHVLDAPGVAVENMTARHYKLNGFYWTGVRGYRASYLTAYNNGDYGVYAFDSVNGQFDHSYASGHPDSGFYIGQCYPCHAAITDVIAENNALGYSGTNAGGDLVITASTWRNNMSGIVPNTLDSEALPPQREITIRDNIVAGNNNATAPAKKLQYPGFGIGILLAGGVRNLVTGNDVRNHEMYGIAVMPNLDKNLWISGGNVVRRNVVRNSGVADLALGAPGGGRDCFADNDFSTSAPPAIEILFGCAFSPTRGAGGDLGPTTSLLGRFAQAESGRFPHGDWRTQPEPPAQPSMPDAATAPGRPAIDVPNRVSNGLPATRAQTKTVHKEVTMLGFPLAAPTWWSLLISTYGYALPFILYAAWVSIALWDLVRREDLGAGARAGWMAAVLVVPLAGPIGYYVAGRSPIPRSMRWMLVGGGMLAYVAVAAAAFAAASA